MSKAAKGVTKPSWNVLTTEWMEAMDLKGRSRLVAPLSALHDAQDLHRIVAPNPLDLFAAHRFLITLLYWKADACGGVEKLRSRLLSGTVPAAVLGELKAEEGAFDLFDPKKPFLQDPTSKTAKVLPPSSLFAEMASGTNIAHFHHGDDDSSRLCMRCAIKGLARLVPWTQSGGRGKPPSVHGAPPIMAIAIGATLCETLGLNLVPLDGPFGKPQWSGQFRPAKKTKTVPLMEALTWNPRRVHLLEPRPPEACGYCGTNSIETVGQIVFLGNKACEKDKNYVAEWRDPAAFYRPNIEKIVVTRDESDAAIGSDVRCLFLQQFGSKQEPAPVSKVIEASPGHSGWLIVLPCTDPKNNKSYDHRMIQVGVWPDKPPPQQRTYWDASMPLGGANSRKTDRLTPTGDGALAFTKAALLLEEKHWAILAHVENAAMDESAAAFDILTSIYWPLRNEGISMPSRKAAWMTLKLMATARSRRNPHAESARPWEELVLHQPEHRSRSGKVTIYPRRVPPPAQLERELRQIIHRISDQSIDWAGLCQFLNNTLA